MSCDLGHSRSMLVLVVAFSCILAATSMRAFQGGSGPIVPNGVIPLEWDHFSADIGTRRSRVRDDGGQPTLPPPDMTFRLERFRNGTVWKTVTTVISRNPIVPGTKDPSSIPGMKVVNPGDGSPVQLLNPAGQPIRVPTPADYARIFHQPPPTMPQTWADVAAAPHGQSATVEEQAQAWADGWAIPIAGSANRLHALQMRDGPAIGKVGVLDRYLHVSGASTTEVLIDPTTTLPMEVNIATNGQLATHATYGYSSFGADRLVRSAIHVEQPNPANGHEHLITDIAVSRIHFDKQGGAQ